MKNIFTFLIFSCFFLAGNNAFSQGATCAASALLCDPNTSFSLSTTGTSTEDTDCYTSTQDGPNWYTFAVAESGDISITIVSTPAVDIDFGLWGPFSTPSGNCGLLDANRVDCGYSSGTTESFTINGAASGEFYILNITNYLAISGVSVSMSQTNTGATAGALGGPLSFAAIGNGPFCETDAAINLITEPAVGTANLTGVTFSGTGITDGANGTFDPATAGVGTHTITVMGTSYSCPVTKTLDIIVDALPDAQLTCPTASVSINSGLYGFAPADGNTTTASGAYTGDGAAYVDASGMFDPSASGVGTFTLNYTLTSANSACTDMATCMITVTPPTCASTYNYTASNEGCQTANTTFAIDAGCSVTANTIDFSGSGGPATGTVNHLDLDIYFYNAAGLGTPAPVGYDPFSGGTDDNYPITNTDLSVVPGAPGVGNSYGTDICTTDLTFALPPNSTCSAYTITYFMLPYDYDRDSDGDGLYGEYYVGSGACSWIRKDIIIYPVQPTAAIDDTELCSGGSGTITVSVAGNSCFTEAYTAPANMTCAQITEANLGIISIADIETGLGVTTGSGCYAAIDVPVDVNPAQPTATETPGSCNTAAQVQLTAANAALCGTPTMGTAPTNLPCGNGTNSEPLSYTFAAADIATAFGGTDATCYTPLTGTVTADCTQSFCPLPTGIALGISDPCVCNGDQPVDDATLNGIGSFGEIVSVTGTGGVGVYYISAITANGSAATGTLPTGVAVGDVLTPAATQHDISFTHYDGDGYTMEITWAGTDDIVGNADDMVVGSIGNRCAYASVVANTLATQLNCSDAEAVALTATIVDGGGVGVEVWSDDTGDALGVVGSDFNGAGLMMGTVNVTLTYTGAITGDVSPDQGATVMYPGCEATSSIGVSIMECPCDADNGTLQNGN